MWPKKSIGLRKRTHLDGLALSPFSFSRVKTVQVFHQLLWCLSEDYDVIEITGAEDEQEIM